MSNLVRTCLYAFALLALLSGTVHTQGIGSRLRDAAKEILKGSGPAAPATQQQRAPDPPSGGLPEPDYRSMLKLLMAANADILNVDTFAWEHYLVFDVSDSTSPRCLSLRQDLSNEFSRQRLLSSAREKLGAALRDATAWPQVVKFRLRNRGQLRDYDFARRQFSFATPAFFQTGSSAEQMLGIKRTKTKPGDNGWYFGPGDSPCTVVPGTPLAGQETFMLTSFPPVGIHLAVRGTQNLATFSIEPDAAERLLRGTDANRWVDVELEVEAGPAAMRPGDRQYEMPSIPARIVAARVLQRGSNQVLYTYPAGAFDGLPPTITGTSTRAVTPAPASTAQAAAPSSTTDGVRALSEVFAGMLAFRDNPTLLTDQMLVERTTQQVMVEQRAWQFIQCYATTTPIASPVCRGNTSISGARWNPKRRAFLYEWQQSGQGRANSALLDVFVRPDADWSFATREPDWDDRFDQVAEVFVFSRTAVEGRAANFAAQELAPVYRELLTRVAADPPRRYSLTVPLPPHAYDFSARALRFARTAPGQTPNVNALSDRTQILGTAFVSPENMPASAASTANYALPSVREPAYAKPGRKLNGADPAPAEHARGVFSLLTPQIIALDRQLELSSIPMEPARAEALEKLRTLTGGLVARIQIDAQRVEAGVGISKGYGSVVRVLFARLEQVEIVDPAGNRVALLEPGQFGRPSSPPRSNSAPSVAPGSAASTPPASAPTPAGMFGIHGEWVFRPSGQPQAQGLALTFAFPLNGDPRRPPITVSGPNGLSASGQFQATSGWFVTSGRSGVSKRATLTLDEKGVMRMVVQGGGSDPLPNGAFEGTKR